MLLSVIVFMCSEYKYPGAKFTKNVRVNLG